MSELEIILAVIIAALTLFIGNRFYGHQKPAAVEPPPPEPFDDTDYEALRDRVTREPDPVSLDDAADSVLGRVSDGEP